MAKKLGEGRGRGVAAGAGGKNIPAIRSKRSRINLPSFATQRIGKRGRESYWGAIPSDERAFALPNDKPLTDHERGLIANRRERNGRPADGPLDTPELLWIARKRDGEKSTNRSRHKIPDGLVSPITGKPVSHATLVILEKRAAAILTEYWLQRGEIVLFEHGSWEWVRGR